VASGIFAEPLPLRYLLQSLVIDDLHDGGALGRIGRHTVPDRSA